MRNVALAHTLFEKGKIGEYIPEETYQAIAEILDGLKGIEDQKSWDRNYLEIFK